MKKAIWAVLFLGLCACDKPNEQQVVQEAKIKTEKILVELDKTHTTHTLSLAERKNNHELKMLKTCHNRFAAESIRYNSSYVNNICICFAEKTTEFVASSEQEINKYNSSKLYQLKIQERFFNECADKYRKYQSGI